MVRHRERHLSYRVGWLRAMVLGANDGIISTAALVLGVAAADSSRSAILTAGIAGLTAGAISMALGEYVSVASQRDSERADIEKEQWELTNLADHELDELTAIYRAKGLSAPLAREVAVELTEHDALGAHLRDELGIERDDLARPMQAALSSAVAFTVGALLPLLAAAAGSSTVRVPLIIVVSLVALVVLGFVGARVGGAAAAKPIARVVAGGALAMAVTMLVGSAVGAVIG